MDFDLYLDKKYRQYAKANRKLYTREQLCKYLPVCSPNTNYYDEPCTLENDPDGMLKLFPRDRLADKDLVSNCCYILSGCKNQQKVNNIVEIVNKYVIIDKEPVFDPDFYDGRIVKEMGKFHVDKEKLPSLLRHAINYYAGTMVEDDKYITSTAQDIVM